MRAFQTLLQQHGPVTKPLYPIPSAGRGAASFERVVFEYLEQTRRLTSHQLTGKDSFLLLS